MANDFTSNITRKVMRKFLDKFESKRVLSKNVNTQLFQGKFNPSTGDTIDVKRPTDYTTFRNATGDLTSSTADDIVTGKASAVVQDYFTTHVEFDEADQAIKMDQLDELLDPMATRIVTDLELDYANFMMINSGLVAGNVGTAADTWDDIAEAGAILQATGVPMDAPWNYAVNPFTQRKLASTNRSLGAGGAVGSRILNSLDKATIMEDFAGMRVMTATTLSSYNTQVGADRAGTMTGAPDPTYAGAKDTMTQSIPVTAFQANLVVKAGEVLSFTGISRLNLSTRTLMLDDAGAVVTFTAVVTADVTLGASGEGNIIVSGPGIFEAGGAFNTISSALLSSGVVTLLGAAATVIQPNLFWHRDAFTLASVPIKRLHSTDTFGQTEDGLQFRVSKGSNFTTNEQRIRIDFRPAYGVMNPFFAGHGHGS